MRHLVAGVLVALLISWGTGAADATSDTAYITNAGEQNDSNSVAVVDLGSRTVKATVGLGSNSPLPFGVTVLPDGSRVYVTNFTAGTVSAIDTRTNRPIGDPLPVGLFPAGISAAPSGRWVYVVSVSQASFEGRLSVISVETHRVAREVSLGRSILLGVASHPTRPLVYVAGRSGKLWAIDVSGDPLNIVFAGQVGTELAGIAVAPDGHRIYVADYGGDSLWVVDADNYSATRIPVGDGPFGVAVSPKGDKVYVTNEKENTVSVVDPSTLLAFPVPVGASPRGIAVSSDGRRVYAVNWAGGSVSVFRPDDLVPKAETFPLPKGSAPNAFGNFLLPGSKIIVVQVDVKPGGNPNVINLKSRGTTPVAILGSTNYDVTQVNVSTVRLAGAEVAKKPNGAYMESFDDVNGDGLIDLVLHFETASLQVSPGDTSVTLEGQMNDGTAFRGTDSVKVVP